MRAVAAAYPVPSKAAAQRHASDTLIGSVTTETEICRSHELGCGVLEVVYVQEWKDEV